MNLHVEITAVLAVLVLVAIGWWLSYTAARLDRMHTRVEGAVSAVDAYAVRRAQAAAALAASGALDPASALLLAAAAGDALERTTTHPLAHDLLDGQRFGARAQVEGDLTEALRLALPRTEAQRLREAGGPHADAVQALRDAAVRLQLACAFHDEAVSQARALRSRPVVRACHLAGHARWPERIEFDDALPDGLVDWPLLGARSEAEPDVT